MSRRGLFSKKLHPLAAGVIILFVLAGQLWGWFDVPQQEAAQQQQDITRGTYLVSRFVDGDTFVTSVDGKDETVRIIGIDTPETHAPGKPVQCYGPAAAAYLKTLIGDQRVTLEGDQQNDNRDRYGRLLRHVYLQNGDSVALAIIQNGYGFAYTTYPFDYEERYVGAEAQARAQAKGLWANCDVVEQGTRKQTAPLQ